MGLAVGWIGQLPQSAFAACQLSLLVFGIFVEVGGLSWLCVRPDVQRSAPYEVNLPAYITDELATAVARAVEIFVSVAGWQAVLPPACDQFFLVAAGAEAGVELQMEKLVQVLQAQMHVCTQYRLLAAHESARCGDLLDTLVKDMPVVSRRNTTLLHRRHSFWRLAVTCVG